MEIYTLRIPKQALMKIPSIERQFFLLAGHFFNELMILSKLMIMTQDIPNERILNRIGVVQAMFINKMMAGKLYEGWNLVKKQYYKTYLSKQYDRLLDEEGRDGLDKLKRYFSKPNAIHRIRTSFAFHYDPTGYIKTIGRHNKDWVSSTMRSLQDEECEIYLAEENLNSLYYISEAIMGISMIETASESKNLGTAFDTIYGEIVDAHRWFISFVHSFMIAVAKLHLALETAKPETVSAKAIASMDEMKLPWFVDTSAFPHQWPRSAADEV